MLTSAQTASIIAAGERHATAVGVPVNIAVLDAGTHLKGFSRMDGALLGSVDVAIAKARTSALFGVPSEAVWDWCKPGAPGPGLDRSNGGLMPIAGGVPLHDADGTLSGALGVSGGSVDQDFEIAQAAVAALTT